MEVIEKWNVSTILRHIQLKNQGVAQAQASTPPQGRRKVLPKKQANQKKFAQF
jgi:hypothetical protein